MLIQLTFGWFQSLEVWWLFLDPIPVLDSDISVPLSGVLGEELSGRFSAFFLIVVPAVLEVWWLVLDPIPVSDSDTSVPLSGVLEEELSDSFSAFFLVVVPAVESSVECMGLAEHSSGSPSMKNGVVGWCDGPG